MIKSAKMRTLKQPWIALFQGPISAAEGDDASTPSPGAGAGAEVVVGEVKELRDIGLFMDWSQVKFG